MENTFNTTATVNPFLASAIAETQQKISISENKIQLKTDEVIATYPNGVTITAFDVVETEDKHFSIILFAENPNAYFYGGTVLTKLCENWLAMTGLDAVNTSTQLANAGGVKIKLSKATTKDNKRSYTKVDVIQ